MARRFGSAAKARLGRLLGLDAMAQADDAMKRATALYVRHLRTGDSDSLRDAVRMYQAAVALAGEGHPEQGRRMAGLANALLRWSELTGDADALNAAVSLFGQAIAAAGYEPQFLLYLARVARLAALDNGSMALLARAEDAARRLVELTPA